MRGWRVACSLMAVAAWLAALPASAQDGWRAARGLYGAAIPGRQGATAEQIAREVLRLHGPTLGLADRALRVVRVTPAHGYVVVELAAVVHDEPVRGAPIVVRLRPDRAVDTIEVSPTPEASAPWPQVAPLAEASEVAITEAPFPSARVLDAALVPLVHGDAIVPAVAVELAGVRPAERARLYVDASSLALIWLEPRTLDALGRVYPRNPTSDAMTTMDLTLADLTSTTNLDGTHVRVSSCDQLTPNCNTITRATADVDGNFLYDPDPRAFDDAFAEVSAYYHASLVMDYFRTAHGFTWTCMGGTQLDVVVNYTEAPHVGYENAFFSPGSRSSCGNLVFGQGTLHDYAYDGDVVYHEFGHAVTDQMSSLGFFATGPSNNYQPLGINEGTSDYWAAAVQGDPHIGESIGSVEGFMHSLRGLDDVVSCPADLMGEGHADGRIWSTFGWAMRGVLGATRADAIWFTAMASMSGGVTLAQATNLVLSTIASEVALGHVTTAEQAMIMDAATMRGLTDCTMFVPVDDGLGRNGYSGNAFVTGGLSHGLAPLQYTVQIPPDVVDVEVDIGHGTLGGLTNVHFMTGGPVRASGSRVTSQLSVPVGRIGTARFTRAQGLEPCTTLYIGVETTDLRAAGETLFQILARVNTTHETRACPPPRPDAGPARPDAGHDSGPLADAGADASTAPPAASGCACRAGASRASVSWIVLVAALLGAARRRR